MVNEMTNDAAVAIQRYDYTDPVYADYNYFGEVEGGEFVRYSDYATTVAELRAEVERLTEQLRYVADACEHETARADAAERRVADLWDVVAAYKAAHEAVQNNPAMLLSDPTAGLKCAESMQSLELARMSLFAALTKDSP